MTKPKEQEMIFDKTHSIDDAFTVKEQRWGTWVSYNLEGKELITSMTKEACTAATHWYLKSLQDGFDDHDVIKHEGQVGGKL